MEVKRHIKLYQTLGFQISETEMIPKPNGISIPVATMLKNCKETRVNLILISAHSIF